MPKVSVIIPCFNLGKYINEAIESVLNQNFQDFEIIVVNDGSTDSETNFILRNLAHPKIKLISTENQGLSRARNNGITASTGKYILPLDADDKIAPTYLDKAVSILDRNEKTGIVYCLAEFFDRENSKWDLPSYKLSRILLDNLIFCSAFFRRRDWETVGGYKPTMIYGWEDYEFWISIIELKREVYQIPEYLFFYRNRKESMANIMSRENYIYSYKEIVKNHQNFYVENIEHIFEYIYSLRDLITAKHEDTEKLDLDVRILNEEVINLNQELAAAKNKLIESKQQLIESKQQFNDLRILFRQLAKSLLKKVF